jgi:hypothetical protein
MRQALLGCLLAACAPDDTGETDDTDDAQACTAQVRIGFYSDEACTNQVGSRVYDTSLACFSWTADGSGAEDNSATRFQCWSDRLCYTQHAGTLTCEDGTTGPTDKEAQNGVCIKEPAGTLYSMLLSGNEDCPDPPDGFECPASLAQEGTDGVEACVLGG